VRRVRRAVVAAGLGTLLLAIPSVAGAALPPLGSTSASDDVTVPVIPPGTTVTDAVSWLTAATAARGTALTNLVTSVNAATGVPSGVRTSLLTLLTTDQSALAQIATVTPTLTTLAEVHQAIANTIGLHVFAVVQLDVSVVLAAGATRAAAVSLLAQESSIRAAIAAAKSVGLPVGNATAEVRTFHGDLEQAKALASSIPVTLRPIGTLGESRAAAKLAAAAATETTAAGLVVAAKSAEQSIVSSLASRLRSQRRSL